MKTIIEFDHEAMTATMKTGDAAIILDVASFHIDKELDELPDCADSDGPAWLQSFDTGRRTITIKGIQCSK